MILGLQNMFLKYYLPIKLQLYTLFKASSLYIDLCEKSVLSVFLSYLNVNILDFMSIYISY